MKPLGKRSLLLVLTLVLAVGLVAVVWAEAPKGAPKGGHKGMMRHGAMNLTPEQAGQLFDAKEKFRNDTAALRKQLFVGKAEMGALWKAETPDEKAILAKVKELSDLREQLMEKKVDLHLQIRKIVPHGFWGMGMGGGCGMGHGMEPGGPGEAGPPAAGK
ncbi:MAG: periplasmic heavy metal sensor [Desulfobaccales bacterium]|jgi:Spy/CpxP family protein refolding chaperone